MRNHLIPFRLVALMLACAFVAAPVAAKDGEDNGRGHGKQREKAEKRRDKEQRQAGKRVDKERKGAGKRRVEDVRVGGYFSDQHRKLRARVLRATLLEGEPLSPGARKEEQRLHAARSGEKTGAGTAGAGRRHALSGAAAGASCNCRRRPTATATRAWATTSCWRATRTS